MKVDSRARVERQVFSLTEDLSSASGFAVAAVLTVDQVAISQVAFPLANRDCCQQKSRSLFRRNGPDVRRS